MSDKCAVCMASILTGCGHPFRQIYTNVWHETIDRILLRCDDCQRLHNFVQDDKVVYREAVKKTATVAMMLIPLGAFLLTRRLL